MIAKKASFLLSLAGLLLFCVPVFAHHGTGSSYDATKQVTFTGVVDEFVWANPHSQLFVNVKGPDGTVTRWGVEMNSPGVLARAGWTRRRLKPGDEVTVTVHPSLAGTPVGVFRNIKFPDGTTYGSTGAQATNTN